MSPVEYVEKMSRVKLKADPFRLFIMGPRTCCWDPCVRRTCRLGVFLKLHMFKRTAVVTAVLGRPTGDSAEGVPWASQLSSHCIARGNNNRSNNKTTATATTTGTNNDNTPVRHGTDIIWGLTPVQAPGVTSEAFSSARACCVFRERQRERESWTVHLPPHGNRMAGFLNPPPLLEQQTGTLVPDRAQQEA